MESRNHLNGAILKSDMSKKLFKLFFMKALKFLSFTLLFVSVFAVSSCKKEGCTDALAQNYSSSAKKDDGSCNYQEKLIFWQDLASADSWVNIGVNSLKFYVNGQYIGSCLASDYMVAGVAPSCSSNGQASYTIEFGKNKSAVLQIKVTDETDFVWYDESITVTAGTCNYYQVY